MDKMTQPSYRDIQQQDVSVVSEKNGQESIFLSHSKKKPSELELNLLTWAETVDLINTNV